MDQIRLEDALDKYCQHVGIKAALDLRAYNNMSASGGVDIMAMANLLPLLWTLVDITASQFALVSMNFTAFNLLLVYF